MAIAVRVAVVDEGGRLIAFGRMDQPGPMSVYIAVDKAYTSAAFQVPTAQLSGLADQSWFQRLIGSTRGKVMAVAGAPPVLDVPNIIGVVGVSGGTKEQEQGCCRAAVTVYS